MARKKKYASLTADLIKREAVPCRFIGPNGLISGYCIMDIAANENKVAMTG